MGFRNDNPVVPSSLSYVSERHRVLILILVSNGHTQQSLCFIPRKQRFSASRDDKTNKRFVFVLSIRGWRDSVQFSERYPYRSS